MIMKVTWIGQGGFMFELGDKIVVVDPYLSNSVANADGFDRMVPAPFTPQELKADLIICTHDHMDHLDEETIKYTDFSRLLYAGPDSCLDHFRAIGIPDDRLISLNVGQSINIGDAVIHGVYAAHTQDSIGVVIEYDGLACYLVGDSLYEDRLLEAGKHNPDVLMSCINGKLGNMNYMDAANLAEGLGVKLAIPCHYGMFKENTEDPEKFLKELQTKGIPGFIMEYNKPYCLKDILDSVKSGE
jgi:L-ascorbate 6-phosphate lactonase